MGTTLEMERGLAAIVLAALFTLVAAWLIGKILFKLVCLNFGLKIDFDWSLRRLQFANIEILKSNVSAYKSFEIRIEKIWLSSCYLNRNINDRIVLGLSNVNVNIRKIGVNGVEVEKEAETAKSSGSSMALLDVLELLERRLPVFWLHWYFKYVGCLLVETLTVSYERRYEVFVSRGKVKFRPDTQCVSLKVFDVISKLTALGADLFLNKLVLSSQFNGRAFGLFKVDIDSVNLATDIDQNIVKRYSQDNKSEETGGEKSEKNVDTEKKQLLSKAIERLKKLESVRVNKFLVNNRFELCKIELLNDDDEQPPQIQASISSVDCFKNSEKLLKNWRLVYSPLDNEIRTTCDFSNLYISLDLFESVLTLLSSQRNGGGGQRGSNVLKILVNHHNCYVNLIDECDTITLGAKSIRIEAETTAKRSFNVKFHMQNFLIFKSSRLKAENSLFGGSDRSDFLELFKRMNEKKFLNEGKFNHIWGNLVNLNELKLSYKSSKSLRLFMDRLFVEYSPSILDLLVDRLRNLKLEPKKVNQSGLRSIRVRLNQANVYFLFEKTYFVYASVNSFSLMKRRRGKTDSFHLKVERANGVQFRVDIENSENNRHQLNSIDIDQFQESDNQNLLFLLKKINLNLIDGNQYYLSLNDVLVTWSLKIHFILNEVFFKHTSKVRDLIALLRRSENGVSTASRRQFDLKVIIESSMLINFLYDYSQDASKVDKPLNPAPQATYFNSHFSLVETVSVILSDVCFSYSNLNKQKWFDLCINDVSMLVNMDDQSLCDDLCDDETRTPPTTSNSATAINGCVGGENPSDSSSLTRRKFFSARKMRVTLDHKSERLLAERKLVGTRVTQNKLAEASFDTISVNYLFKYDFAKLLDHVLNLRKCLMLMHGYVRRKKSESDALSYDFLMSVKQLKLSVEDDPFEVKLAYNYALIVDEHLESIKRRQTLEQRRSIRENNLEKHALELLREREAKIYLKRSQAIYYEPPTSSSSVPDNLASMNHIAAKRKQKIRTELFCWSLDQLEIYALSDSDWHGPQKCYKLLREIDHDSAPPVKPNQEEEGNEKPGLFDPAEHYSILWCRHINFSVGGDCKLSFRDYTQPLLRMQKLIMWGKLLGSEYEPAFRSKRTVKMGISPDLASLNYCSYVIERSMSPFKFYHDFSSKMNLFTFAYGPCWEGSMAQLNLSIERIIHPARDPSRPMPWWDKCRLYMHGRMTSLIQQCHIIYHVSMDPYNRTEEMKLVWSNLYLDWTNQRIFFKGILDVYLNTESKYDDCCLLHLPNLELGIDIDWLVKKQSSGTRKSSQQSNHTEPETYHPSTYHNDVQPCAPDKIPLVVNSLEHDSYSKYRSEAVSLYFSFVCSEDVDIPTCKFYASTLRFLERIKLLLSTITRPTKRGRLFKNVRPRKPILSRHFRSVHFYFDVPAFKCIYWSSASEQYGVQVDSKLFKMNSALRLELTPFQDSLKRRPRPNWFVDMMQVKLENLNFYLMSPDPTCKTNESLSSTNSTRTTDELPTNIPTKQSNTLPPELTPGASTGATNQAENDLLVIEFNERSVRFLDAKPAVRNFFMRIDSIYYERDKSPHYYTEVPINVANKDMGGNISISNHFKVKDKTKVNHWFSRSLKSDPVTVASTKSSLRNLARNESINGNDSNSLFEHIVHRRNQLSPTKTANKMIGLSTNSLIPFQVTHMPKHNLLVKNLKAKWNNANRNVVYMLYEIYFRSKRLRHNLSSQALKEYDLLTDQIVQSQFLTSNYSSTSPKQENSRSKQTPPQTSPTAPKETISNGTDEHFEDLLTKLDSERASNLNVYCDEPTGANHATSSNFNDVLYGPNAISKTSDIVDEHVFIEFINSQIKLSLDESAADEVQASVSDVASQANPSTNKKSQKRNSQQDVNKQEPIINPTRDYLIISAARTNVIQHVHKPVWKSQRYLEKTSLSGNLESMQYFATLNTQDPATTTPSALNSNKNKVGDEFWLSDDLIDPKEPLSSKFIIDIGSGSSVASGATISSSSSSSIGAGNDEVVIESQKALPTKRSGLGVGFARLRTTNKQKTTGSDDSRETNASYPVNTNPKPVVTSRNQLQLIVSKCRCEFYMIDFDDKLPDSSEDTLLDHSRSLSASSANPIPTANISSPFVSSSQHSFFPNQQSSDLGAKQQQQRLDLNSSFNEPMDCLTLIHHDLNICTNSRQYKSIMDLVNNLVLYFRPRRKQVLDKQKSIKFNLQLSMGNLDSLKHYIQCKQIETKELLCQLRALEKRLFHLKERIENEIAEYNMKYNISNPTATQIYAIHELRLENKSMEKQYRECKKALNKLSDELNISIGCYKEIMIEKRAANLAQTPLFVKHVMSSSSGNQNESSLANSSNRKMTYLSSMMGGKNDTTIDLDQLAQQSILNNEIPKRYEIWFKNTKWRLNNDDGKTCLALFLMRNFLYTKVSNQAELDCVEHTLEIESCKLEDLTLTAPTDKQQRLSPELLNKSSTLARNVFSSLYEFTNAGLNHNEPINIDLNSMSTLPSSASVSISPDVSNSSISMTSLPPLNESVSSPVQKNSSSSNLTMIRIYCKERPPVGIPVIEHLELNISPLSINLTNRFFRSMIKFFFFDLQQSQMSKIANNQAMNVGVSSPATAATVSTQQQQQNSPAAFQRSATLAAAAKHHHSYNMSANEDQLNAIINFNIAAATSSNNSLPMASLSSSNLNSTNATITNNTNTNVTNSSNNIESQQQQQTSNPGPLKSLLIGHNKKASQTSLKIASTSNSTSQSNMNETTQTAANNEDQFQIEDIEIMKQRSANNSTFLCIKIPEIQLLVSYRGSNRDKKNIKDLTQVSLLFPLFEVHDKTWTWLDLINALKSHVKKALVSQALKHKLIKVPIQPVNKLINRRRRSNSQHQLKLSDESEKLTISKLFGAKFIESKTSSKQAQKSAVINANTANNSMISETKVSSSSSKKISSFSDCEEENNVEEERESFDVLGKTMPKRHALVKKSHSTLSMDLKRRFLKFSKDKTASNQQTLENKRKSVPK